MELQGRSTRKLLRHELHLLAQLSTPLDIDMSGIGWLSPCIIALTDLLPTHGEEPICLFPGIFPCSVIYPTNGFTEYFRELF